MTPVRRTSLAMAGYVCGLLLLFGAAFVFLGGLPGGGGPAVETKLPSTTERAEEPAAAPAPEEPRPAEEVDPAGAAPEPAEPADPAEAPPVAQPTQ